MTRIQGYPFLRFIIFEKSFPLSSKIFYSNIIYFLLCDLFIGGGEEKGDYIFLFKKKIFDDLTISVEKNAIIIFINHEGEKVKQKIK